MGNLVFIEKRLILNDDFLYSKEDIFSGNAYRWNEN
jgi:hypothetical protein